MDVSTPNALTFENEVYFLPRADNGINKHGILLAGLKGDLERRAAWRVDIPVDGLYRVSLGWQADLETVKRSPAVPVIVHTVDGDKRLTIDQTRDCPQFRELGIFRFRAGKGCKILSMTNKDIDPAPTDQQFLIVDSLKIELTK